VYHDTLRFPFLVEVASVGRRERKYSPLVVQCIADVAYGMFNHTGLVASVSTYSPFGLSLYIFSSLLELAFCDSLSGSFVPRSHLGPGFTHYIGTHLIQADCSGNHDLIFSSSNQQNFIGDNVPNKVSQYQY
jgi:hypothetical protein